MCGVVHQSHSNITYFPHVIPRLPPLFANTRTSRTLTARILFTDMIMHRSMIEFTRRRREQRTLGRSRGTLPSGSPGLRTRGHVATISLPGPICPGVPPPHWTSVPPDGTRGGKINATPVGIRRSRGTRGHQACCEVYGFMVSGMVSWFQVFLGFHVL